MCESPRSTIKKSPHIARQRKLYAEIRHLKPQKMQSDRCDAFSHMASHHFSDYTVAALLQHVKEFWDTLAVQGRMGGLIK
jgi:hypothetical protein